MSLSEEDIKAVVFYRKEKAYATLREAEDMIAIKHWNLAMQRMYYCIMLVFIWLRHCWLVRDLNRRPMSRIGLTFSFFMNYKSLDIQKIRCVIRSCPDGLAVTDLIVRSGAEPLRVYPILFELEQSGWLEVTERSEWGAPRWVRKRIK